MQIKLGKNLELSRIVHGEWRISHWDFDIDKTKDLIEYCLELGVDSFDHADIYGSEPYFGKLFQQDKSIRDNIKIISKCGVNRDNVNMIHYDLSKEYIIRQVENSLKDLNTDYLDLFLLHRPDFAMNPEEIALAFDELNKSGKVKNFGVSNFTPIQIDMLKTYVNQEIVTNQVEISPYKLDYFVDGNSEYHMKERINPMAWSPAAGGKVFIGDDEKSARIKKALVELSDKYSTTPNTVLYSWLLHHPSNIIPVIGSGNKERIKSAVDGIKLNINKEDWYKIFKASTGREVD